MKEFTVENMIAACKSLPDMESRMEAFEVFRMMRFLGLIGEELFDAFCEAWNHEFFFVHTKTGQVVSEEDLKEMFADFSHRKFSERDFEAWKAEKIKSGAFRPT